jgi:hypothetical protein
VNTLVSCSGWIVVYDAMTMEQGFHADMHLNGRLTCKSVNYSIVNQTTPPAMGIAWVDADWVLKTEDNKGRSG